MAIPACQTQYIIISWFFSTSKGLLCDLLWADPDKETVGWGENDRGVSFTFGPEIVSKFLCKHDLDLICRAHQVCGVKRALECGLKERRKEGGNGSIIAERGK